MHAIQHKNQTKPLWQQLFINYFAGAQKVTEGSCLNQGNLGHIYLRGGCNHDLRVYFILSVVLKELRGH